MRFAPRPPAPPPAPPPPPQLSPAPAPPPPPAPSFAPAPPSPAHAAQPYLGLYDDGVSGGREGFLGLEHQRDGESLRLGVGGGARGEASLGGGLGGDARGFLGWEARQLHDSGPAPSAGLGLRTRDDVHAGSGGWLGAGGRIGPTGVGAGGEAFLGARLGGGGGGMLSHDGRNLAGGRGSVEGLVGVGLMGGGNARFQGGQLDVDASAGASLGVGANVGGGFSVNPGHIARAAGGAAHAPPTAPGPRRTQPADVFAGLYHHTDEPGRHERFLGIDAASGGDRLRIGAGGGAGGQASVRGGLAGDARGFFGWEGSHREEGGPAASGGLGMRTGGDGRAGAGGWLGAGGRVGPTGLGAGGEAFLGARLGGGGGGTLTHDGHDLAGGRGRAEGLVGVGLMGGGNARVQGGQLDVDANAGASLGVGANIGGGVSVNPGNLVRSLRRR